MGQIQNAVLSTYCISNIQPIYATTQCYIIKYFEQMKLNFINCIILNIKSSIQLIYSFLCSKLWIKTIMPFYMYVIKILNAIGNKSIICYEYYLLH